MTSAGSRLNDLIESTMPSLGAAERTIANFLLVERHSIPFETASSLAEKLGVSPATVGRFCRRLGYSNFRALKADLRYAVGDAPWPIGADRDALGSGQPDLQRDRDMTIAGITEVYRLAETPEWDAILALLTDAEEVIVAGFQTERGIAEHFAHILQYVRPCVWMADLSSGNFAEILADDRPGRVLVMVETRRYSRQAKLLAERCAAGGVTLVIVTDKYCHWAKPLTRHVLSLPDESALFFSTLTPILAALTLLAQGVVLRLGATAEPRLARVSQLYQDFTGHVGQPRRRERRLRGV